MKKQLILISIFFLFHLVGPPTSMYAEEHNTTKPITIIAVENNVPFSFELADGSITGLYIEFWKLWSEVNHIPIKVELLSFEEGMQAIKENGVIHSGLYITDGRKQWADFSLVIHKIKTGIVYSREHINTKDLRQLSGFKVATQRGTYQATLLAQQYPNIELVFYENSSSIFYQLLNNDIQAIVGETPGLKAQLAKLGLAGVLTLSDQELMTHRVHSAFAKGQPQLKKLINQGFKNIPIERLIALENLWLPNLPSFYEHETSFSGLTLAEQEWLYSNDSFSLGIDSNLAPFEFVDDKGVFSGITSDYISYAKNTLDIKFDVQSNKPWSELLLDLKQGKLDVISGIVKTKERAKKINFTVPYINIPTVLVIRKDNFYAENLSSFSNKTLGIIKGYIWIDLIKKDYPLINIETFNSVEDGLKSLQAGRIHGFIEAIAVVNYEINKHQLTNLVISSFTPYKLELSMGIRKGLEPLVGILDKVFLQMDEKQKSIIANNWLRIRVETGTDTKTILLYGLPLISIFIIIILSIVRINKRMHLEIFERKKAEQSYKDAKNAAEVANQAKGNFLANMSHEIRTPMNAIVGITHLLQQSNLDQEQLSHIDILKNSSKSLVLLINDILDLSKIESGKLEIENEPFNLSEMLSNISKQMMLEIDVDNVKYEQHLDNKIPSVLVGDSHRLSQILLNIIKNSSKFTKQGYITLSVSQQQDEKNQQDNTTVHLLFKVSDSGIGMTPEQMERLFQTYSQADSSTTRKYGGTGLGLSISKNLSELMGGSIWATSTLNQGTCFYISTQLTCLDKNDPRYEKINQFSATNDYHLSDRKEKLYSNYPQLTDKRILVVDDNLVNTTIVEQILTKAKVLVTTAKNGQEAVSLVETHSFDVILMDIQMPIMDGYTATKQIRKSDNGANLPILALSANAMASDIKLSREAGMNGHLSKPIDIKQLLNTLHRLFEPETKG